MINSSPWRHNERDSVSNHRCLDGFTQPFVQVQIKESIKASRHWPVWEFSPVTGEFPAQRASNAVNVSIWGRYHF